MTLGRLDMSAQDFLNIEQLDDGVLHLELKNAPVNALTATSLRRLGKLFLELSSDPTVAAVLLASGLKVFSAGLNLKDAQKYDICLLYTSPSPRDLSTSRMPSSA